MMSNINGESQVNDDRRSSSSSVSSNNIRRIIQSISNNDDKQILGRYLTKIHRDNKKLREAIDEITFQQRNLVRDNERLKRDLQTILDTGERYFDTMRFVIQQQEKDNNKLNQAINSRHNSTTINDEVNDDFSFLSIAGSTQSTASSTCTNTTGNVDEISRENISKKTMKANQQQEEASHNVPSIVNDGSISGECRGIYDDANIVFAHTSNNSTGDSNGNGNKDNNNNENVTGSSEQEDANIIDSSKSNDNFCSTSEKDIVSDEHSQTISDQGTESTMRATANATKTTTTTTSPPQHLLRRVRYDKNKNCHRTTNDGNNKDQCQNTSNKASPTSTSSDANNGNSSRTTSTATSSSIDSSDYKSTSIRSQLAGSKNQSQSFRRRRSNEDSIKLYSNMKTMSRTNVKLSSLDTDNIKNYTLPTYPKSYEAKNIISNAVDDSFVFLGLQEQNHQEIINAFQREDVKKGHTIIKKGDIGDYFYILQSGTVAIENDGEDLGTYTDGRSFGELALLYDSPRAVDCIATTDCRLWKIDRHSFKHCIARATMEKGQAVLKLIDKIPLFEPLSSMQRDAFIDCLVTVSCSSGEKIIQKGEVGETFYIITDGTAKVHDIGSAAQFNDIPLGPGDWFGELALLNNEPRKASVTATSDCTMYAMSRQAFEKAIGPIELIKRRYDSKKFLLNIPLFSNSNFEDFEMDKLVDKFTTKTFTAGTKLISAGEPITQSLYVVMDGGVLVVTKDGGLLKLKDGDYFGDATLKADETELAKINVTVDSDTVCKVLTKSDIVSVIGDINRLGESSKGYIPSFYKPDFGLDDLDIGHSLGKGAYGTVYHVRSRDTHETYALKKLNKRQLVDNKQVGFLLREKNVMQHIEHPFILGLVANFQDENHAYLVLPLVQGGDLYKIIQQYKALGRVKRLQSLQSEMSREELPKDDSLRSIQLHNEDTLMPIDSVLFYSSCIADALLYLHERNIAHRDLKPENIMIDKDGYCVLVDFGLAKVITSDKTFTVCGTPEYMSPEIVRAKGHNLNVDCWAFACIVYEMMVGKTPFYNKFQIKMFAQIAMVTYSTKKLNSGYPDAVDLFKSILKANPAERLRHHLGGESPVRTHPFFKTIDWDKLRNKEMMAPYIPKDVDDKSFEIIESNTANTAANDSKKLTSSEQALFNGF